MNIYDSDFLIATLRRSMDWKPGLDFITEDEDYLQVGTWNYDKGRILERHEHNYAPRKSMITQECVYVVSGSMEVNFYSRKRNFLCSEILIAGDYAVIFGGGHEYKILEDNTKVLETKNGPFLGVEIDKTKY